MPPRKRRSGVNDDDGRDQDCLFDSDHWESPNSWSTSICDPMGCCDGGENRGGNCAVCADSFLCYHAMLGFAQARAQHDETSPWPSAASDAPHLGCMIGGVACALDLALACLGTPIVGTLARSAVRQKYRIRGDCVSACAMATFMPCCSVAQLHRELLLHHHGAGGPLFSSCVTAADYKTLLDRKRVDGSSKNDPTIVAVVTSRIFGKPPAPAVMLGGDDRRRWRNEPTDSGAATPTAPSRREPRQQQQRRRQRAPAPRASSAPTDAGRGLESGGGRTLFGAMTPPKRHSAGRELHVGNDYRVGVESTASGEPTNDGAAAAAALSSPSSVPMPRRSHSAGASPSVSPSAQRPEGKVLQMVHRIETMMTNSSATASASAAASSAAASRARPRGSVTFAATTTTMAGGNRSGIGSNASSMSRPLPSPSPPRSNKKRGTESAAPESNEPLSQ